MPGHDQRKKNRQLGFESLEGKVLLSGVGSQVPVKSAGALLARVHAVPFINADSGEAAILSAISGGAGHEFVTLIRKQLSFPAILSVEAAFASGAITEYRLKGAAFKITNLQHEYAGLPHDPLSLTVGGGVLLKRKTIEFGAIVRGPFTTYPGTTYIVFAIDRGAGPRLGPAFASRPAITPDTLVTVRVGPFGQSNSATVTDLATGQTQPLDPSRIRVNGPVVRLLIPTADLPSQGLPVSKYRFAIWTRSQLTGGIENVGSFLPENSMIPLGAETNVPPPKL
jgi:hypothetical protein